MVFCEFEKDNLVFHADFSCEFKSVPTEGFLHVDMSCSVALFSAETQFAALI